MLSPVGGLGQYNPAVEGRIGGRWVLAVFSRVSSAGVGAFGGLAADPGQCGSGRGCFGGLAGQTGECKSLSTIFMLFSRFRVLPGHCDVQLVGARAEQVHLTSCGDLLWPRLRVWAFCRLAGRTSRREIASGLCVRVSGACGYIYVDIYRYTGPCSGFWCLRASRFVFVSSFLSLGST